MTTGIVKAAQQLGRQYLRQGNTPEDWKLLFQKARQNRQQLQAAASRIPRWQGDLLKNQKKQEKIRKIKDLKTILSD